MGVAVVTDSTGSLHPDDAEREGITVVPLQVIIGAESHLEGPDVTSETIAEALKGFVPVSTSRPSPEEFARIYERLAATGATAIVSVHLSSKMSGTVEAARVAAKDAPVPVHVVDSHQVGLATGFAAGRAARAAAEGADAEAVARLAETAGRSSSAYIYVDTMEYLRRGGRVNAAQALLGTALAVKPILTIRDGLVEPLEKVRTASKALARVENLAAEAALACVDGFEIGVQHLDNEVAARQVSAHLAERLGLESVPVDQLGAVIGAHVGPGTVGVTVTPL